MQTINGFQIREAIKYWKLQIETLAKQFTQANTYFPGEDIPNQPQIMQELMLANEHLLQLEVAQQRYNLEVTVKIGSSSEPITLSYCVKAVSPAGRIEKMWRDTLSEKEDRYDRGTKERMAGVTYAVKSTPINFRTALSHAAAKYASSVRNAIARANGTNVNIDALGLSEEDLHKLFVD